MLQIMYTAAPWLRDFSEWYGALPCHSVNGKNASKSCKSCQRYIAPPKIVEIVRCTYIIPVSWCNLSFLLFFVRFYLPFYRARFSFDRAQLSCAFLLILSRDRALLPPIISRAFLFRSCSNIFHAIVCYLHRPQFRSFAFTWKQEVLLRECRWIRFVHHF